MQNLGGQTECIMGNWKIENNKGISRVVSTRGYNWNTDVKMPLVKLSDIN